MAIRILDESPSLGGLYVKAGIPAVPGLGPLARRARSAVAGTTADRAADDRDHGDDRTTGEVQLPDLELRLPDVSFDADHLARYADVCGFIRHAEVPATYPHVLAFPLHLELMTDPTFPFDVLGLIHVRNRIEQRRTLRLDDTIDLTVRAEQLRPHPKGSILTLVSEAAVHGDVLWRERDGRAQATPRARRGRAVVVVGAIAAGDRTRRRARSAGGCRGTSAAATRQCPADRNPIHLSALTARAFGFQRHIAHGMWTKARSLAALDGKVPESFAVEVEFRKPIPLPTVVDFGAREQR